MEEGRRGLPRLDLCASRSPAAFALSPAVERPEDHRLATIRLNDVTRSFQLPAGRLNVLDCVTLSVAQREVVAVIGPNGSGKSTLLRLIGGLIPPDTGTISIDDQPVSEGDPRVGLVFQEPRLLPWRRAVDNVAFPLQLVGMSRQERRLRAMELLELVGMTDFADAYPHQLSGGMRQRVAIARALARHPSVLLMDEPFSALDALTRERFNLELLSLWQRTATTIVLVTHSIPEAVFLADRVIVLSPRPGRVVAELPVELPRPRRLEAVDEAAYSSIAASIRSYLAETDATAA
ncbi:MAG TPA: ABC transporter ATP-binding protein [Candidatus Limnocylindrales bacterium]|nr:ABC transporter ATP-binding protein [Candidatus Limnocylindrales bacterium]